MTAAHVPAGQWSAEFAVPTTADAEAEPAEQVRWHFPPPPGGSGITVTGTVTDAPPGRS